MVSGTLNVNDNLKNPITTVGNATPIKPGQFNLFPDMDLLREREGLDRAGGAVARVRCLGQRRFRCTVPMADRPLELLDHAVSRLGMRSMPASRPPERSDRDQPQEKRSLCRRRQGSHVICE